MKVGDIIVAKIESNNIYSITNERNNFIGKVIKIIDPYIEVRDIEDKGSVYSVEKKYFRLAFPSEAHHLGNKLIKTIIQNENRK